ncbi:MAG TPA: TolC family protein [Bacteroidales bacterium]
MFRKFYLFLFLSGLSLVAYNQTRNLDFYLTLAKQNSPLLNEYRNQLRSAISDSLLIRAAKKPLVEARSQLLYSPFYHNFGYDEVITDGGNYTAVLGVSQYVFNKREINNKYEAVDLQKRSFDNSSRISINELNKIITAQYLTAFSDYSDLLFNRNFLELLLKENEIVKQFVINGIAKKTDYLSLLVETQTQEILVNQLKSQYRKNLMLLSQLSGIIDSVMYELDDPKIEVKGSADITKSPTYIQYKIDSIRIENEKAAIDIRYNPKVNWFADAGFLTSNPWNFYKHFGYSAGLSLNIPVYDGKQRSIQKQKLDFNENTRQAYKSTYYKQYSQQIQQLNLDLNALNEMSVQTKTQLKTSEQLVNTLKEQLEAGIIQMTDYINAIKNFKTTSRNVNLLNIQKEQVINELNFVMTK